MARMTEDSIRSRTKVPSISIARINKSRLAKTSQNTASICSHIVPKIHRLYYPSRFSSWMTRSNVDEASCLICERSTHMRHPASLKSNTEIRGGPNMIVQLAELARLVGGSVQGDA